MTTQLSDGDSAGQVLGQSATDKIGFYGATPIVQRTNSAGAAVTATVSGAVATTGATNSSPYGFVGAAQGDAIVANVNALRVDVLAIVALVNELRAAVVALGLHKGS